MRGISPFGIWTCAALYAAAGVFGLFFLTSQPNAVPATDGYGVIRLAVQSGHFFFSAPPRFRHKDGTSSCRFHNRDSATSPGWP